MTKRIPPKRRSRTPLSDAPAFAFHDPSPDEKSTLIRKHAERRVVHPSGNVFGMYIGVAVCAVLVLVGWVISLPKTLGTSGSGGDAAIEAVQKYGTAFTQSFANDKPLEASGRAAADLIESMKRQAEAGK